MLNIHGVAATCAAVSGLAMLADKPLWSAVYILVTVGCEACVVAESFASLRKLCRTLSL